MVTGSIYSIPKEIGQVDVTTFCSVLLHLRDIFLTLARTASLARETMVITETMRENRFLLS